MNLPVDPASELIVLAARLMRQVRRAETGDSPGATIRLLSLLDETGPSTVGDLARLDQCSQPTMTGLINGLADRGLAERTPHPRDSRANLVSLTDLGQQTLAGIRARNGALVAQRLARSPHTAQDLETAVAVLRGLLDPDPTSQTDPTSPSSHDRKVSS